MALTGTTEPDRTITSGRLCLPGRNNDIASLSCKFPESVSIHGQHVGFMAFSSHFIQGGYMATTMGKLLNQKERESCEYITKLNIGLFSRRAKALLLLDDGHTQVKSAELSKLTIGQLRYLLVLFKEKRMDLFPGHTLPTTIPEETSSRTSQTKKATAKKKKKDKNKKEKKKKKKKKDRKKNKNGEKKKNKDRKKTKEKKGKKKNRKKGKKKK
jgi:hypothetical protein